MQDYEILVTYILDFFGLYTVLVGNFMLVIYLMQEITITISVSFVISITCGLIYKFDFSNMIGDALVHIIVGYSILFFTVFIIKMLLDISKTQES
jgi:hypothetical protein